MISIEYLNISNTAAADNGYDSYDEFNFIQMKDWFDYHGHICIALEMLGPNVHEFMINNNYKPYSIEEVKQITYQVIRMTNFIHTKKVRIFFFQISVKNQLMIVFFHMHQDHRNIFICCSSLDGFFRGISNFAEL